MPDVCLVSMPYDTLEKPSISVSTLIAALKRAGLESKAIYATFWFAEKIGMAPYILLSKLQNTEDLISEWTFSNAAFPNFNPNNEEFLAKKLNNIKSYLEFYPDLLGPNVDLKALLMEIRQEAIKFINEAAKRILDVQPEIIGCSSTYQQHCASLALLRKVKELAPEVITMIGGANCEGIMGVTTKRLFPWVDFVISGEADDSLPLLCEMLLKKGKNLDVNELPQGVFSEKNSSKKVFSDIDMYTKNVSNMDTLPIPDHDDYFMQLNDFVYKNDVYPAIIMESSRGCWWGQKKSCTFCALNGTNKKYRSKSPERVIKEIDFLHERYTLTNFLLTDNILDNKYFDTVIPELATKKNLPYLFFYETKSSLTEKQVIALADAGIRWIQPGVESLHDKVLKLMNKGNSAIGNVALLKFAMENGVSLRWIFLCGFPFEEDAWYIENAAWLPMIIHLQPPLGLSMGSVRFDRYNRYHNEQKNFGLKLSPVNPYSYIYPFPESTTKDLAYYFQDDEYSREKVFKRAGIRLLNEKVKEWQGKFRLNYNSENRANLTITDNGKESEIIDTRPCAIEKKIVLKGLKREIYQRCRKPRRIENVIAYCKDEIKTDATANEINAEINEMKDKKILLFLNGKLLSLALKEPQRPLLTMDECYIGCKVSNMLIQ